MTRGYLLYLKEQLEQLEQSTETPPEDTPAPTPAPALPPEVWAQPNKDVDYMAEVRRLCE